MSKRNTKAKANESISINVNEDGATVTDNAVAVVENEQSQEVMAVQAPYQIGDILEIIEPRKGIVRVAEELPLRKGDQYHFLAWFYNKEGIQSTWRIHINQDTVAAPGTIPVPEVKAPKAKKEQPVAESIPEVDLSEVVEELE